MRTYRNKDYGKMTTKRFYKYEEYIQTDFAQRIVTFLKYDKIYDKFILSHIYLLGHYTKYDLSQLKITTKLQDIKNNSDGFDWADFEIDLEEFLINYNLSKYEYIPPYPFNTFNLFFKNNVEKYEIILEWIVSCYYTYRKLCDTHDKNLECQRVGGGE